MANRKNLQIIGNQGSIKLLETKFQFKRITGENKNG